jgi:arsenate reductase
MHLFYYLSSCDTCKKIMKTLALSDDVRQIDIKKSPLTAAQLELLYQHSGSYEALLNKRAQKLKEIDKRPVLLYKDKLYIGNAKATIALAKEALDG